jgi:predicted dehydrogenase
MFDVFRMKKTVRWGILAAGGIAHKFAEALSEAEGNDLYAVASRDAEKAKEFGAKYGRPKAYGSYEAMLEDPEVEAVYIATLHPFHLEWIVKSVQAGKHVLCEKPLAMNLREAKLAKKAADEQRCLLREAFMYRHHPQTQKLAEIVESGAIGPVRLIETNFCVDMGVQPESRCQAKELGGGSILDLGCYAVSLARLVAGRALGRLFAEPVELKAVGHLDAETHTDMWTTASLRFEQDILAKCSCAMRIDRRLMAIVSGENGRIEVDVPWFPHSQMRVYEKGTEQPKVYEADTSRNLYVYEIESFGRELRGQPIGAREVAMRFDDTLGNMKALDRWREEIGLRYEADFNF